MRKCKVQIVCSELGDNRVVNGSETKERSHQTVWCGSSKDGSSSILASGLEDNHKQCWKDDIEKSIRFLGQEKTNPGSLKRRVETNIDGLAFRTYFGGNIICAQQIKTH